MDDSKVNILLVDDKPEKLLALESVLEELGQRIVCAYSGRDALRSLLKEDFALILLDVNMPGMDGFETANLIRQRPASRDVPIIFVTAYGDETHIARGYSMGAVDYIHTPVVPEVLRSKAAVFVELHKKSQQVRRQSESLRNRAGQLQRLAEASVTITSAVTIDKMLHAVTDSAREVIGAHQAITLFTDPRGGTNRIKAQAFTSFSPKYATWRSEAFPIDAIMRTAVFRSGTATRLSESELHDHPDWEIVRKLRIPPISGGILAAPLVGRNGKQLGVIYLCDRGFGPFSADDEMVAVQLAQFASIAIENFLFAEERDANLIKDEFLSMLSHELRTPLNAILGWTQLLRLDHVEGELGQGLEVIERNARAQAKLVEDMLDVSRITSGKLRLNRAPLTLAKVVQAAVEAIRPEADSKGINLAKSLDEAKSQQVFGDPDRLQQVVWNLLSNAVKFTPKDGRVTVQLDRVNGHLRLRVADTGEGIPAGFLPFVFDRFRQVDTGSRRVHGGLGIGLTIVRQIVELHGGTVSAESPGEQRGSTFQVLLPVLPIEMDREIPALSPTRTQHSIPLPNHGDAALTDIKGKRVLAVDDERDTLNFLSELLRRAGAEPLLASSATEAIELYTQNTPDVIISDIGMPERDGYDLIQCIRELEAESGGQVPIIAMTAFARDEDRRKILSAGFRMHLSKPIEPRDIIRAIGEVTQLSGSPNPSDQVPGKLRVDA